MVVEIIQQRRSNLGVCLLLFNRLLGQYPPQPEWNLTNHIISGVHMPHGVVLVFGNGSCRLFSIIHLHSQDI